MVEFASGESDLPPGRHLARVEQTGAARASAPAFGGSGGAPGPSGNAEPNGVVGGDRPRAASCTGVHGSAAADVRDARRRNAHGTGSDAWTMISHKLHRSNEMATAAAEMDLALR